MLHNVSGLRLIQEHIRRCCFRPKFDSAVLFSVLAIAVLWPYRAKAADYEVRQDGSGSFKTIQACANVAKAGDSCQVYPGSYNEHVKTASGGTSDSSRITFKAMGVVSMQGFDIGHPYVTVDGFDITGYAAAYTAQILVTSAGSNCAILNNILHDAPLNISGIWFYASGSLAASNCVVRGNTLSRLGYPMLNVNGDNHLFEQNRLEYNDSEDFIRLFGSGSTFRRNVFWRGSEKAGTGQHPDFVQNFGSAATKSENHLFEENWISDLTGAQFCQTNSGDGNVAKGVLYDNIKNITFIRNIIANIPYNCNIGMPGVRFENNTFYRMAYSASGLVWSGTLTRGSASNGTLVNNAFVSGGNGHSGTGYYTMVGAEFTKEVIALLITGEPLGTPEPIAAGILSELRTSGYINSNGHLEVRAKKLSGISPFFLSSQYDAYRQAVNANLIKTVRMDAIMFATFAADYNYVYPAKGSTGCVPGITFTSQNFCEAHGLNGGDGRFANVSDLLGPDGIPFTLDDGLKPLPTSPLCGKGSGGTDIGAYSCDPNKVFVSSVGVARP